MYGTRLMNFAWCANKLIKLSVNVIIKTGHMLVLAALEGTVSGCIGMVL